MQPVATCRQSPYLHKPAIVIVTSFSLWRLARTALAAPLLIMTSFSLWRHSLLSWPRPPLRTYVRTDTLPRLIYKDTQFMLTHTTWGFSALSAIAIRDQYHHHHHVRLLHAVKRNLKQWYTTKIWKHTAAQKNRNIGHWVEKLSHSSQGSVGTLLTYAGTFNDDFTANLPLSLLVKTFANRFVLIELTGKSIGNFLTDSGQRPCVCAILYNL